MFRSSSRSRGFSSSRGRNDPQRIRFFLFISAAEFLRYYEGTATMATVVADDGRRIRFPARHLRAFVTQTGIQGRFEMLLDKDNRFLSMKKISW